MPKNWINSGQEYINLLRISNENAGEQMYAIYRDSNVVRNGVLYTENPLWKTTVVSDRVTGIDRNYPKVS